MPFLLSASPAQWLPQAKPACPPQTPYSMFSERMETPNASSVAFQAVFSDRIMPIQRVPQRTCHMASLDQVVLQET